MGRGGTHQLESERRPVVSGVPDQHRQEHYDRDQRRKPGGRTAEPAPTPARHQHERQHGRDQHHRGEFGEQRQSREQAGGQPPAAVAAFVQSDQRPQHRDRERDQRHIGRDLGHQETVVERRLRHQHRQHDRTHVMGHAPHEVRQQQLRDQHRQHAGEPDAEIGVTEDRGTETDEPRNHRRMIEKGEHVLLRPGPVIGLIRSQIDHAGIDHPHHGHRRDQRHDGQPVPVTGPIWFGAADVGRGCRHGAFSPTPAGVSTCSASSRSDGWRVYPGKPAL